MEAWSDGAENVKCLFKCATCCLECLERLTDYINESAFCYCAVSGDSFLNGAVQSLYIKIEYLVMVATATYLAKVFIFIGKVAIVVGNVFIFKLVLVQSSTLGTGEIDKISSTTGPMVVVAVITYIFVSMFIGMFDETVNAMLTCVAIDTKANGEPIYGPETFNNCVGFDED